MCADFLEHLKEGVSLVTPSRRLAGLISDRYNTAMMEAGSETWEAAAVLPFGGWLTDSFQRLALAHPGDVAAGHLLSIEQERALWEHVVRASGDAQPGQIENLATLAMNAWSQALLWGLPLGDITQRATRQEVLAFARWARSFEGRCRDLDAIDQHRFAASLCAPRTNLGNDVPPFEFFGYSSVPPLLQQITSSAAMGRMIKRPLPDTQRPPFEYQTFATHEIELDAVMSWAGAQKRDRPAASVLVVLAGVSRIDATLAQGLNRVFATALDGDSRLDGSKLGSSSTTSLADVPIIDGALLVLDWRRNRPWDELSRLLLSPYLGEAEFERDQRALLDDELRRRGDVEMNMTSTIEAAAHGRIACPALANRLAALATIGANLPRTQKLHDWMSLAETALKAAGWPGDGELNEVEQQALLEWHRVMDTVAQLDAVVSPCSWPAAFGKLRSVLRSQRLQQAAPIDAVQIVTLEEAACLSADAVWIAGLHDGAWPDPPEVSPLLPYVLQRDYAIPGADPNRESDRAEAVLRQLSTRHPNAIWSFARTERETPRRALAGHECHRVSPVVPSAWPRRVERGQFKVVEDSHATRLEAEGNVSGGVALFTDQAACPMRAFGRHRLQAKTPADPSPGLSPMQRGNLIHAVMAAFWTQVKSSTRLKHAGENEIEQILNVCVADVVDEFRGRYRFIEVYWELERERLVDLAIEWLQQEITRSEFEVVACEQARAATVGSYIINTRVDRVDRLANGETLLIDYKTGAVSRTSWLLPRPDQPQLPLYAVSTGAASVDGIAYAGVRKGQCKFVDEPKGIAHEAELDADALAQWTDNTHQWRDALSELADELESGLAVADPKRGSATCRFCDLQCFCRIHEAPQRRAARGDDDD